MISFFLFLCIYLMPIFLYKCSLIVSWNTVFCFEIHDSMFWNNIMFWFFFLYHITLFWHWQKSWGLIYFNIFFSQCLLNMCILLAHYINDELENFFSVYFIKIFVHLTNILSILFHLVMCTVSVYITILNFAFYIANLWPTLTHLAVYTTYNSHHFTH